MLKDSMDTLPKPSERGNMMIILIVALLALATLVFFLMSKQNIFSGLSDLRSTNRGETKEEGTPSSKMKLSPVVKESSSSASPSIPLYAGLSWNQTTDWSKLPNQSITVINNKTNNSNSLHLDGTLWEYRKSGINTIEELNVGSSWSKMISYYQEEGKKSGWSDTVVIKDYTLYGINADGGGSSAMGLVKVNGDMVKTIMLLSTTTFASGEFPVDAQCPCNQTYYVFESNEIPLGTLTKQLNSQ